METCIDPLVDRRLSQLGILARALDDFRHFYGDLQTPYDNESCAEFLLGRLTSQLDQPTAKALVHGLEKVAGPGGETFIFAPPNAQFTCICGHARRWHIDQSQACTSGNATGGGICSCLGFDPGAE